jgi:hypothetical protein
MEADHGPQIGVAPAGIDVAHLQAQLAAAQDELIVAQGRRYRVEPPPILNGDDSDRWEVDLWLFSAEIWLQACSVTAATVACAATATRFGAHALRWWQHATMKAQAEGRAHPYTSWETFKRDLKDFLLPPELTAKARKEFYKLYQRSGETTLNFVTRFRAAKARVETLAPHEELHVFVTALPPKLRMEVERDAPGDLDTAIKLALRLANVYEMDNRRPSNHGMGRGRLGDETPRYYNGYQGDNGRGYDGAAPMELGMVTSPGNKSGNMRPNNGANRDNGRGNGSNRRSGPPPNMAADNVRRHLERRLCFRCHRPGHRAVNCPN